MQGDEKRNKYRELNSTLGKERNKRLEQERIRLEKENKIAERKAKKKKKDLSKDNSVSEVSVYEAVSYDNYKYYDIQYDLNSWDDSTLKDEDVYDSEYQKYLKEQSESGKKMNTTNKKSRKVIKGLAIIKLLLTAFLCTFGLLFFSSTITNVISMF